MKSVIEKVSTMANEPNEGFHMGATIIVVLLMIMFVGSGFYLFITNS